MDEQAALDAFPEARRRGRPVLLLVLPALRQLAGQGRRSVCRTWDRPTAHPVLVMGTTVDPATPYRGSVAMARHLARARLLTVEGYGHAVLLNPSSCANEYVSEYVISGALPPKGASCSQDRQPFTPTP